MSNLSLLIVFFISCTASLSSFSKPGGKISFLPYFDDYGIFQTRSVKETRVEDKEDDQKDEYAESIIPENLYFVNLAGDRPFEYKEEERTFEAFSAPSDKAEIIGSFSIKVSKDFNVVTAFNGNKDFKDSIFSGLCGEKVLSLYPSTRKEGDFYLLNRKYLKDKKEYWVKANAFKVTDPKFEAPLIYWYSRSEAIFEKASEGKLLAHLKNSEGESTKDIEIEELLFDGLVLVCDAASTERLMTPKPAISEDQKEPYLVKFDDYTEESLLGFPGKCWSGGRFLKGKCKLEETTCSISKTYQINNRDQLKLIDSINNNELSEHSELQIIPGLRSKQEKLNNPLVKMDKLYLAKGDEVFPVHDYIELKDHELMIKDFKKLKDISGVNKAFSLNFEGKCGQVKDYVIYDNTLIYSTWDSTRKELGKLEFIAVEGNSKVSFVDNNKKHHPFSFNIHSGTCNLRYKFVHQTKEVKDEWANLGEGPWGKDGWIKTNYYGLFTDFDVSFVWMYHRNAVDFRMSNNHIYAIGSMLLGSPEGEANGEHIRMPVDYKDLFDENGILRAKLYCEYGC